MKLRSLICVSAVAAAMSAAATTTVNGANTFCRLPVSSPYASTIIALPFSGCGESQMQIYVTNLVMTANLTTGDTLLWKNASGTWLGWEFDGTKWAAISTASQEAWNAGVPAAETAIPCGQACWLNRANAATQPVFYLYGQVNTNLASATAYAGDGSKPTFTLLGYPTEQGDLLISSLPGTDGDSVLVPADGGLGYKEYVHNDGAWKTKSTTTTTTTITRGGKTKTVNTTTITYTAVTDSDKIAAGLGFMYGRLANADLPLWSNN